MLASEVCRDGGGRLIEIFTVVDDSLQRYFQQSFLFCKVSYEFILSQVYKYREHIYFLQQRFKQDGGSQSSPMFDVQGPPHGNNLSRLYGNTAPQYINEMLLQGNVPPKYQGGILPEGKKAGPGKHGDGTGKQWQYQQVNRMEDSDLCRLEISAEKTQTNS